ncbi:MAG: hypothetical protein Q8R28_01855 [Dehalococcoidia bacterium]|nr:hypothetical protein [Dehalococcoidia bacterium]
MAKKQTALTCLDPFVLDAVTDQLRERGVEEHLLEALAHIPPCKAGELVGMKGKGTRKRSEYQQFVSDCMKGRPGPVTESMKACAAEWKGRRR